MKKITIEVPENAEVMIDGKPYNQEGRHIYFKCTTKKQHEHYSQFTEENIKNDWERGNTYVCSDWSSDTKLTFMGKFTSTKHRTKVTEQEFAEEMKRRGVKWELYNPNPKYIEMPEGAPNFRVFSGGSSYLKINNKFRFGWHYTEKRWTLLRNSITLTDNVLVPATFGETPIGRFWIDKIDFTDDDVSDLFLWNLKTKENTGHCYEKDEDDVISTGFEPDTKGYYVALRSEVE